MGCASSSANDPEGDARNAQIEASLKKDRAAMQREVKILFLGAGESGKSTIVKVVIDALEMLGLDVPPSLDPHIKFILGLGEHPLVVDEASGGLDRELCESIRTIWAAETTKECVDMSHEYQLNDSASYFFDSIDRIGAPNYMPTDLDILRARVKSTGIAEASFDVSGMRYRCFDVGGQRSERKKWVHCFEDVQVLIFIVAISEFNQMLYEDESVSRLTEASTLWDSIANSRWFTRASIILFLNKIDLFQEKLKLHTFADYMPEYTGQNTFAGVSGYLLQHFSTLHRSQTREIFHHLTCATDSKQIGVVLSAVNEQILTANLLSATFQFPFKLLKLHQRGSKQTMYTLEDENVFECQELRCTMFTPATMKKGRVNKPSPSSGTPSQREASTAGGSFPAFAVRDSKKPSEILTVIAPGPIHSTRLFRRDHAPRISPSSDAPRPSPPAYAYQIGRVEK
ncbi:hypothetical protein P7C70_g5536, partial [Phenoliferia sp. Uapishka_3]